ncbi:hypothetical protein HanPSC8_Chr03g0084521 [Helianthus annuus]|nr:hypothetical protein HanPSC8_Chr03g0084521 [Helianthus annuus]
MIARVIAGVQMKKARMREILILKMELFLVRLPFWKCLSLYESG